MTNKGVERLSTVVEDVQVTFTDDKKISKDNEEEAEDIFQEETYPPDGGYGWVIVIASCLVSFVVDGISLTYGVMAEDITKKENQTNTTNEGETPEYEPTVTLGQFHTVGSILLAFTLFTGPVASFLSEKYDFRKTAIGGSLLSAVGIFLSWAVSPSKPNFWAFVLGFGVLTGIGFGIVFTVSIVIVGKYFEENLPLASGITVAGTGIGTLAMAPIIYQILQWQKWQGAMIFQAILAAAGALLGLLYRPVPKRIVKRSKSELQHSRNSDESSALVIQQVKELLYSPSYLITCFSGVFIMMGYFAPFGFLKDSAKKYISEDDAVNILFPILSVCNLVGRVLFGLLATKVGHSLAISNIALTVGGLVTILYPFATTLEWLIVCSAVFGLYGAVFASLRAVIVKKVSGEEKFNVGLGLSLTFMGLGTLFGNSLGGYLIKDDTDYDMAFYVAGGFIILSAVICYPLPLVYKYEKGLKLKNAEMGEAKQQRSRSLVDINMT